MAPLVDNNPKSWADMDKKEREATGQSKKEYNRQGYGTRIDSDPGDNFTTDFQDRDGDGTDDRNQKRPGGANRVTQPSQSAANQSNASAANTQTTTPAQADNRSQANERAQNYTASTSTSTSTKSNQTTSRPVISSQMEGYSTDRKYTGPDGKTYTAKEADDAGWSAGYYDEGGGAYVPQQKTFENPHSAEAIAYRQQYAKDTSKDGKYAEGMKYVSKDDPRRMYDSSANVGYEQDLTPGQQLKQWHMSKAYKQEMEGQGIDWNASGGYNNYKFDMTKGYFVPNQSLRQQRASMFDNMHMREGDRGKLGDRDSYINEYYDPLGGSFEYNNTYDLNLG